MAKITIIAFLALLLMVNNVFSHIPESCPAGETPTGSTCLGFVNQRCPWGQICRIIPGSFLGVCCRGVCPFGSFPIGGPLCGGFVGAQCPIGSFCQNVPNSDYGHCCTYGYD
ncbi:hypothetical protein CHS0354_001041 [Potamilus streckersoni]|uniref:Uncharacterized protein n=1 Tax=Potamilus streckersoni TaxID=2493646 RepID=A0AAE0SV48_9BIVA|nr:hypothetical protein CHS0354_001041 [Potamilus streckersoni]